jgi:FkbM family methyltransferase
MSFEKLLKIRSRGSGSSGPDLYEWMWIASDNGAWEGPRDDWNNSHLAAIREHVKQYRTVIQAGGNQGMYPRLLSDMFEKVYTFEPDYLNFHCLVNNCQQNNIIKINGALGDVHTMVNVRRDNLDNTGTFTVSPATGALVPQFMIDDLCLSNCDLIWLDIEGYEHYALLGALDTIEKFKPTIFTERDNADIENLLTTYGYVKRGKTASDVIFTVN